MALHPRRCWAMRPMAITLNFALRLRELDLEFFLQVDATKHKGWSFEVPTEVKTLRRYPAAGAPASQTLARARRRDRCARSGRARTGKLRRRPTRLHATGLA